MREHRFLQRSGNGEYINSKFSSEVEIFDTPKITDSLVYGGGQIFDSPNILRSTLDGFYRISGRPFIRDSHVSGTAQIMGNPSILNTVISGNTIVKNSIVKNSFVEDNSRLLDKTSIEFCDISDNAVVCGTAAVLGKDEDRIKLFGWDYIEEGLWTRRPMVFIASSGFVVSESINRNVIISCTNNTVEKWLDKSAGRRYGKLVGLNNYQIDELEWYVLQIRKFKDSKDYDMNANKTI